MVGTFAPVAQWIEQARPKGEVVGSTPTRGTIECKSSLRGTFYFGRINIMKNSSIQSGNANLDSTETRGWLVGHFIDPSLGLRHAEDVEIKWSIHKAGDERQDWVVGETRTAINVLITGRIEMEFRDRTIVLAQPGDYVMWGEGADHKWRATEESVALTVRWPSVVNY